MKKIVNKTKKNIMLIATVISAISVFFQYLAAHDQANSSKVEAFIKVSDLFVEIGSSKKEMHDRLKFASDQKSCKNINDTDKCELDVREALIKLEMIAFMANETYIDKDQFMLWGREYSDSVMYFTSFITEKSGEKKLPHGKNDDYYEILTACKRFRLRCANHEIRKQEFKVAGGNSASWRR